MILDEVHFSFVSGHVDRLGRLCVHWLQGAPKNFKSKVKHDQDNFGRLENDLHFISCFMWNLNTFLATRRLEYSLEILMGPIFELNNGKHNWQLVQRLKLWSVIDTDI